MSSGHVFPLDDLVEHNTTTEEPNCVCGPTTVPVERDDGSMAWLIVHHSLDGRERHEEGAS
ncbi:hypothetical protein [Kitasatospora sp. NPDC058478]|uniref:hypothetical protein n=1 Tax=unclassified Kitasatospora TaxID=2633591 RepID=UPI0036637E90